MKRPRPLGLAVVCALSAGAAGATSAVARADDAAPRWERSSRSAAVHVASTNRSGAKRSEDKAGGVLPQGQQRQRESRRERVGEPLHNVETVTRRLVNATATPAPTAAPTPTATVIAVATASASTSASTTHYLSASSSASATFTTSSNVDEEGDETSGMEQGARVFLSEKLNHEIWNNASLPAMLQLRTALGGSPTDHLAITSHTSNSASSQCTSLPWMYSAGNVLS